jgi:hypothetical protein
MKTDLRRISPLGTGRFLGFLGLILSLLAVVLALVFSGPGRTVELNGLASVKFTGAVPPGWLGYLIFVYPLVNAFGGFAAGAVLAWIYNFYARHFGGISIEVNQHPD